MDRLRRVEVRREMRALAIGQFVFMMVLFQKNGRDHGMASDRSTIIKGFGRVNK